MRKLLLSIFLLFLVVFPVGCNNTQSAQQQPEAPTIFGQLSQYVQLGSTQETIAYKLESGPFFVTIRGEVLMKNPAEIIVYVTERESGVVRNDLTITVDLCHAVDEKFFRVGSCTEFDGPLYHHELTTTIEDDLYRADGFEWERAGDWNGTLTITQSDLAETQTVTTNIEIYPARPPSTNQFELFSISLPFAVIGLFLVGLWFLKGRFTEPAAVSEWRGK